MHHTTRTCGCLGCHYNRRAVARALLTIGLLLTWLGSLACGGEVVPLSVVIITLDTTRADALGAYGQPLPSSPRIDAMAAGGTLFEQVVASTPSTLPSHATLFTGRQPYSHGVRSNFGYRLSDENVTLAERLRDRGYATQAEIASPVLQGTTHLDQGFDVYREVQTSKPTLQFLEKAEARLPTRSAEDITERGLAFLREVAEQPFLLWLHYYDAHEPLDPPEPFRSEIAGSRYLAEVRRTDHQVGRVLDELEALGLRERSLVVLTADHGEALGQHGEQTHSFLVYDSTMRVPLVFWGADVVPRGQRVASLVRLADVTPTLLDLLGLSPAQDVQGISLRPLLETPGANLELVGYGESIEPLLSFGGDVLRFVRLGRWKYIHKLEPELYDVTSDPQELRNLAAEQPERVARLTARLEQLLGAAQAGPADAEAEMDPETLAQLRALGYTGGDDSETLDDELATLALSGPDPTDQLEDHQLLLSAWRQIAEQRYAGAEELFRALWSRHPEKGQILEGLITSLIAQKRDEETLPLMRRALELRPESVEIFVDLASRYRRHGRTSQAEQVFREVLTLDVCSVDARLQLSDLLRQQRRFAEQRALLEARDDSCPRSVVLRNALAFLLASVPEASLRDGARALRLAKAVVEETQGKHPDYVDTLAAAYAEVGDFERAVAEQKRALELLDERGFPPQIVASFEQHLASLEAGEPIREP